MPVRSAESEQRNFVVATDQQLRQVATEITRLTQLANGMPDGSGTKIKIRALLDELRNTSFEDPDAGADSQIPRLLEQAAVIK